MVFQKMSPRTHHNCLEQNHCIGLFQKYHNTLCCPSKILHKHCFQFLLGLTIAPREIGNNAYAKFWRDKKEYYGIFEKGVFPTSETPGRLGTSVRRSGLGLP